MGRGCAGCAGCAGAEGCTDATGGGAWGGAWGGAGCGRGAPGMPLTRGVTKGWRGPDRICPGRGAGGFIGRSAAAGGAGAGAAGAAMGCAGLGAAGTAIGGEMGPPEANGGRKGAMAFAVTTAGTSAVSWWISGTFTTGRTVAGGIGGLTTGGRMAAGRAGGSGRASSSAPPPSSCSACGSSSIRYRLTLGSSFRWFRMRRARSSSIELEWVFLSWTPRFGSASMISLGLTSSSLASSLIRILLIDGKNKSAALASRR